MRLVVSVLLLAAALAAPRLAHATPPVEFSLKVTPQTGTMNDDYVATVQITIRGVNGAERFWEPDWGDFTVTDKRTQQSTQWSYDPVTGQEIRSVEVRRFLLKPKRAGRITIGEAKLKVDGVEYTTKPTVVTITAQGGAATPGDPDAGVGPQTSPSGYPPPDPSIVGPTFLHVFVDRQKARVGEQVTVTWLLYTRSEVLKFEPKPPRFDDMWVETLYEPQNYLQYAEDVVGNRTYAVAVVGRKAIFPTKAGKLIIPAYRADVSTMATPFGAPLKLASQTVPIEVEALPPGAPAGFDAGLVGLYEIDATLDRDNLPAGESVQLTLVLRGQGAIRRTKIPTLTVDGFEVYAPRDFQERVDVSGDKVRGERRFEYVLTPKKGGTLPIGPVEVAYFNVDTGRYDVARADLLKVKVVGDPALVVGATGAGQDNVIARDIRPPREIGAARSRVLAEFHHSRYFWLALLSPGGLFAGVIVFDWMRQRLRRETPRARLRRARGRARKRMRVAELHIKGNRPAKFFGEIARVLTEHVEERVGEPIAALTREQLRALLDKRGFPQETVDKLVSELENCDFARFAPSASGPGEMRAAMRRARDLLTAIEKVRPIGDDSAEAAA